MGKYDDIINYPHHSSQKRKSMSMENRAAQFAPFAALPGHNEAIVEAARITDKFLELDVGEREQVSKRLRYAIMKKCNIEITFFEKDRLKNGGKYRKMKGKISKIDELTNLIMLDNGTIISIQSIYSVEGVCFSQFE